MIQMIALGNPMLCLNCETITDATRCPVCVSQSLWTIEKWLGRVGPSDPAIQQPQAGDEDEDQTTPAVVIISERVPKVGA